jgi:signal peptidase I
VNDTAVNEDYIQHADPAIITGENPPRDNFGPFKIPENSFFVLGDNRDQSLDSPYWGSLPGSLIVGKVAVIHFSWDAQSQSLRSERIGLRVNGVP